ncbi:hypothetical protein LTR57_010669 [Friedmanniomyces endolithicus]|nr:hypothetical protein LTS09_000624 [Friedmanniomyces endolithicus]KAK0346864.1 hypothetical protein LTR94_005140 [Friedmanniomyces endolithicus]KAK0919472.1 hypothetical protein LTR57_010669 [Friedmanniomyces endolithicus]
MGNFYGLRGTKLNIAIAIVAGTDFALFGYDQGVMGGLLTLNSFLKYFPQIDTQKPPGGNASKASNVQGITVGAYTLGCFFGAVATIWLGNFLGRKRTIMLGAAHCCKAADWFWEWYEYKHGTNMVSRLVALNGYSRRLLTLAPFDTRQSETSKSHRRGQMVMIEGSLIVFGVMLSYWIDLGFSFLDPSDVSWRFPIAFQILLAVFIVCFIPGLPESPRWLVLKGREARALEVLAALSDLPEDDPAVQDEFKAVKDTVFEMAQGSFSDSFKTNRNRNLHRTILAYVNQMFQQISGINIITYYAATIFHNNIGMSAFMSRLLAALNGTEYFIASWVAIFTIEKFGRRKLMLFGAAGQALSMAVLAGTTSVPGNASLGIAAAIFLFVFNSFFAVGWLGMTWLYPAEITPLDIRAPANAISTTANWIFNFMVVMVTPVAFNAIQWKTYLVFAAINAFMVPCVYFFFPETAYRSLEEMDEIFHQAKGLRGALTVVKIAREQPHRYGKNGELLIAWEDTDDARDVERRRSSIVPHGAAGATEKFDGSTFENGGEKREHM